MAGIPTRGNREKIEFFIFIFKKKLFKTGDFMYDLSQTTLAARALGWSGFRLREVERERTGMPSGRCRHLTMAKYGVPRYNSVGTE